MCRCMAAAHILEQLAGTVLPVDFDDGLRTGPCAAACNVLQSGRNLDQRYVHIANIIQLKDFRGDCGTPGVAATLFNFNNKFHDVIGPSFDDLRLVPNERQFIDSIKTAGAVRRDVAARFDFKIGYLTKEDI